MAYLRESKKEVDIDFPLQEVWAAIPEAIDELDWEIIEKNSLAYEFTVRTLRTLSSYASTVKIELTALGPKTTQMTVYGNTPVTTITSTLQFEVQSTEEIETFIMTLAEVMNR